MLKAMLTIASVTIFFVACGGKKIPEIKEVKILDYRAIPDEKRIWDDVKKMGLEVPFCSDFQSSPKLQSSINRKETYFCINASLEGIGSSVHNYMCYDGIMERMSPPLKPCAVVLVKR